ncbi:MAG: hypothetical protein F6K31_13430 [Symploca sp. SIO2G7]|nr:hypothetical protein [Symploca sp. SIO2G7]
MSSDELAKKPETVPGETTGSIPELEQPSPTSTDKELDYEELNNFAAPEELPSVLEQTNEKLGLLHYELKQTNQELSLLRSSLENMFGQLLQRLLPQEQASKLQDSLTELESRVSKLQADLETEKQERLKQQEELKKINQEHPQLESTVLTPDYSPESDKVTTDKQSAHPTTPTSETTSPPVSTALSLSPEEKHLVTIYNKDPNELSRHATEVTVTEKSLEERRLGSKQPAMLETTRKGNYWIVIVQDKKFLVPKANCKINEHNYQTVAVLFECQGYHAGYSSFKLRKPGKVSQSYTKDKWELTKPGVLQFD